MQEAKRVLLICCDGCEDIETIAQIDVLTRGAVPFTIATANGKSTGYLKKHIKNNKNLKKGTLLIKAAYGTTFIAHEYLEDCEKNVYEMITLPGGLKNAEKLAANPLVIKMLQEQKANNRWYCAICASPAIVFQGQGIIDKETPVTSYPAFWEKLANQSAVKEKVVVSGKCITSQGAGTALEYSLALLKALEGEEKAKDIGKKMLSPGL